MRIKRGETGDSFGNDNRKCNVAQTKRSGKLSAVHLCRRSISVLFEVHEGKQEWSLSARDAQKAE